MPFFLKLENIIGSVTEKNHLGWIPVSSLDFGVRRNISIQPGQGNNRETSMPKVGEFILSKPIDKSSPVLLKASCCGVLSSQAVLHACHSDDGLQEYLQYILHDALISHYDISGVSVNKDDEIYEKLHISFSRVEMKFTPIDGSNMPETPIVGGYDISEATYI